MQLIFLNIGRGVRVTYLPTVGIIIHLHRVLGTRAIGKIWGYLACVVSKGRRHSEFWGDGA